jgi:HD-GYP domain-containing protein (c-di-GMP phosphodiesterase class II)/DNA-binding CsgD family transcriptional regulator
VFGDEIAIRAQTLVHDAADPQEVMRDVITFATANHPPEERDQVAAALTAGAPAWARYNFASGCEVGDVLVRRLGFGTQVRQSLQFTFERWNGNGFPSGARGTQIPIAMRIVHLSHDMEAIARRHSPEAALAAARDRRDRTYDPELSDLFAEHGATWFERLAELEPWDAVLTREPEPHQTLDGDDLDNALSVAADFIDLKSPFMAGHSRRCARLAERAGRELGLADDNITRLRRAALVHEFGTTAVPNSVWDKPGTLTRAEFERVEVHPMITEQMLRRSAGLATLNPIASAHHEKSDRSGYHKHLGGDALDPGAQVLTAVDIYVGLTADRADRRAFAAQDAAHELRRLAAQGLLAHDATEAVLVAAGHTPSVTPPLPGPLRPGGLSRREVEVLRLAARGLTTREIADRLYISPKTADHHIQHVYTKIGTSTRAAAALWAMQNGIVS